MVRRRNRTGSGSGQLIVPPHRKLFTTLKEKLQNMMQNFNKKTNKAELQETSIDVNNNASKLVGQVLKKPFYPIYLLVVTFSSPLYTIIGDPDLPI